MVIRRSSGNRQVRVSASALTQLPMPLLCIITTPRMPLRRTVGALDPLGLGNEVGSNRDAGGAGAEDVVRPIEGLALAGYFAYRRRRGTILAGTMGNMVSHAGSERTMNQMLDELSDLLRAAAMAMVAVTLLLAALIWAMW